MWCMNEYVSLDAFHTRTRWNAHPSTNTYSTSQQSNTNHMSEHIARARRSTAHIRDQTTSESKQ